MLRKLQNHLPIQHYLVIDKLTTGKCQWNDYIATFNSLMRDSASVLRTRNKKFWYTLFIPTKYCRVWIYINVVCNNTFFYFDTHSVYKCSLTNEINEIIDRWDDNSTVLINLLWPKTSRVHLKEIDKDLKFCLDHGRNNSTKSKTCLSKL